MNKFLKKLVYSTFFLSISEESFCTSSYGEQPPMTVRKAIISQPPRPDFSSMTIPIDIVTVTVQQKSNGELDVSQRTESGNASIRPFHSGNQEEKIEGKSIQSVAHAIQGRGAGALPVPVYDCLVQRVYLTPTKANIMYNGEKVQEISYVNRRESFYHEHIKESDLPKYFIKDRNGNFQWNGR